LSSAADSNNVGHTSSGFPRHVPLLFDFRDNDAFESDDIGLEFSRLEDVQIEASRALAELAREVLPGSVLRILSIEVRTALAPVLRVSLRFEVEQLMNVA
jgi:hypothetical protein